MIFKNPLPRLGIGQLHLQPQLDPAASHQSWRQMVQVHGGHHDADASRTLAFEAIEHGQQVSVQTTFLTIFEDHIGIINKITDGELSLAASKTQ